MMDRPAAVEPVNMILPIAGCSARPGADLAVPGDDGQEAVGEFLVEDLGEGQDGQRGHLGGLDHHGVAHPEGGGDLPDGDHHGPVPRADGADDADGLVVQFGVGFAVVHHDFRVQRGGGGGAEPGGAGADFEAGVGAVQGFALLAGEQAGEFFGGAFDGVGCFEERGAPGLVAQRGPRRLGGRRGGDGLLQVRNGVHGGFADGGAGGGVKDGPGLAGVRGDRGQQGVVSFHGVLHFE